MQKFQTARLLAMTFVVVGAASLGFAQARDFSKVEIKTVKLTDTLYALFGAGGNIGMSAGPDGVYLIDDQFAPLSEKILAAVRKVSDKPIRFVVNTHWHRDHTGGNENLGKEGATIVAHENVRKRMSAEHYNPVFKRKTAPAPDGALPQLTYKDGITLHLNGEHARIIHAPAAHTDGDSFVHFTDANVIHAGDLFFNGIYPFIDAWSGGSIAGLIVAVDKILAIAKEDTRIIPGHGPMASRADLVAYRKMLETVRARVSAAKKDGKSAADMVGAGMFTDIEKVWGDGFLDTQRFIAIVYEGMG